jgi:hypothetical protein
MTTSAPGDKTIPFQCPRCKRSFTVSSGALGQKTRCQYCGAISAVPKPPEISRAKDAAVSGSTPDATSVLGALPKPIPQPHPDLNRDVPNKRLPLFLWGGLAVLFIVAGITTGVCLSLMRGRTTGSRSAAAPYSQLIEEAEEQLSEIHGQMEEAAALKGPDTQAAILAAGTLMPKIEQLKRRLNDQLKSIPPLSVELDQSVEGILRDAKVGPATVRLSLVGAEIIFPISAIAQKELNKYKDRFEVRAYDVDNNAIAESGLFSGLAANVSKGERGMLEASFDLDEVKTVSRLKVFLSR